MNEETFNRTKRMFLKRLADNFWYDGQWKFSYTLKKNHQIARDQRSRVTQALRRSDANGTRRTFDTREAAQKYCDMRNEEKK